MDEIWQTVERPGYFGSARERRHAEFDARFGAGSWRLAWQAGDAVLERDGMTMLYEDAYMAFLEAHPEVLEQLLEHARDVYDDDPSNVASGLDYRVQETARTHVQDIAIRRCVVRLGRVFAGSELLQIRDALGEHELSMALSPGQVPFHRPELLLAPELDGWWQAGSVESFYQSNKLLQRRAGR